MSVVGLLPSVAFVATLGLYFSLRHRTGLQQRAEVVELAEDVRRALALLSRRHDAAIRLLPGTLGHALPPDEVIRNLEDDFARAAAEIERVAPKRLPARAEALRALRREIEALLEDMPRVNASPETWERPPSAAPQRHLH